MGFLFQKKINNVLLNYIIYRKTISKKSAITTNNSQKIRISNLSRDK